MSGVALAGGIVLGLLLAEARVSRDHERRLLARGATCPTGDGYRLMAFVYPGAFLAMTAEGLWRARALPVDVPAGGPEWVASGVLLFIASKALKYWAIVSLGDRWTFKVIVEPGRPLVATGPYQYVSHPNYIAVVGEFVGAALMLGALLTGPLALFVFAPVLWARIRFEERILAWARRGS